MSESMSFENYLQAFSEMSAEQLIEWLKVSLTDVPLPDDVRAYLKVFAERLISEKQSREQAEATAKDNEDWAQFYRKEYQQ